MRGSKTCIPDFVIVKIARALIPSIKAFFESDEGKIEFEKWKRQKDNSEKRLLKRKRARINPRSEPLS